MCDVERFVLVGRDAWESESHRIVSCTKNGVFICDVTHDNVSRLDINSVALCIQLIRRIRDDVVNMPTIL